MFFILCSKKYKDNYITHKLTARTAGNKYCYPQLKVTYHNHTVSNITKPHRLILSGKISIRLATTLKPFFFQTSSFPA